MGWSLQLISCKLHGIGLEFSPGFRRNAFVPFATGGARAPGPQAMSAHLGEGLVLDGGRGEDRMGKGPAHHPSIGTSRVRLVGHGNKVGGT